MRRRQREAEAIAELEPNDERWLLTYSDMITLLMSLFLVMWSISSVNIAKFDELKASLHAAFAGNLLPASTSILNGGPSPLDHPATFGAIKPALERAAAQQDLRNLERIRNEIEQFAKRNGFAGRLRTSIDERGLVLRLLTDEVLFDTGRAVLKSDSRPLLGKIASLLASDGIVNPVRVEGNTDDVPISSTQFPSNWELSTARADAVLEFLLGHGVAPARLSAAGYADQRPVASNATARGRTLNRRVDLVVLRRSATGAGATP